MKRKHLLGLGTLMAAVALMAVSAAQAHPLYVQAQLARGPICVNVSTSLAEGPAAGGVQQFTDVGIQAFGNGFCLTAKNLPAYDVLVRRELYRWNGVEWRLCATNGWVYNLSPTSYKYISQTWNPAPCGNNSYYGGYGYGYGWMNGQWHGGYLWVGYHWI